VLCGCHDRDAAWGDPDAEDEVVSITFTLSIPDVGGTTRAETTQEETWSAEYDSLRTTYDDVLDYSTLTVTLLNTDGDVLTDITSVHCVQTSASTYSYIGSIPRSYLTEGQTYRCMVTAGMTELEDYPGEFLFLTSALPTTTKEKHYLPMWGVNSFTFSTSGCIQIDQIPLLKAVAKARVRLSSKMTGQGHKLQNLQLHTYNERGSVLPLNYKKATKTTDLTLSSETFRPVEKALKEDSIALHAEPSATDDSWIIYFPEFANTSSAPTFLSLELVNDNNKDAKGNYLPQRYTIDFKDYSSDAQIKQLVRNHFYDFEITGIAYGLSLKLSVKAWDTQAQTWDFTEQITVATTLNWTLGTYSALAQTETDDEDNTLSLLRGVSAVGTFKLETPQGATWLASLTPNTYFAFDTGEVDNDGNPILSNNMTGEVDGKDATLSIRSRGSDDLQHEAKLTLYLRYKDGTSRCIEELSRWSIISY
jgi:hypothetical protein